MYKDNGAVVLSNLGNGMGGNISVSMSGWDITVPT